MRHVDKQPRNSGQPWVPPVSPSEQEAHGPPAGSGEDDAVERRHQAALRAQQRKTEMAAEKARTARAVTDRVKAWWDRVPWRTLFAAAAFVAGGGGLLSRLLGG